MYEVEDTNTPSTVPMNIIIDTGDGLPRTPSKVVHNPDTNHATDFAGNLSPASSKPNATV